jgi:hypothetical protein
LVISIATVEASMGIRMGTPTAEVEQFASSVVMAAMGDFVVDGRG